MNVIWHMAMNVLILFYEVTGQVMHSHSDTSTSLKYETDSYTSDLNYCDDEDDPFINSLWGIHKTLNTLRGNMSKQAIDISGAIMAEESPEEETVLPPTYIVLQVASNVPENTLKWLIDKIRGRKRDGGGELVVMKQPFNPDDALLVQSIDALLKFKPTPVRARMYSCVYVFHVSASKIKFLEVAEEMELRKKDRSGKMREFTVAQLEDFLPDDMHVDDLLTVAERQSIVRHELENVRALAEDDHIPGYATCNLYEGQSILQVCQEYGILTNMFPLHDHEVLKKFGKDWYMSALKKQPIVGKLSTIRSNAHRLIKMQISRKLISTSKDFFT
ncbi:hypothetical protein NQ317_002698 [Molorchus minor]|uniref:Uncharacterized protein n=1 Tax=Molorchus minor TaxID=1323400 RepID=A0ABQ9J051_9CUCU|nr:hypothetical protein NQ317_002698 [Molorchus minor]